MISYCAAPLYNKYNSNCIGTSYGIYIPDHFTITAKQQKFASRVTQRVRQHCIGRNNKVLLENLFSLERA
jgi:hypothetical protein